MNVHNIDRNSYQICLKCASYDNFSFDNQYNIVLYFSLSFFCIHPLREVKHREDCVTLQTRTCMGVSVNLHEFVTLMNFGMHSYSISNVQL